MKFIQSLVLILLFVSCAAWRVNDSEKVTKFPSEMRKMKKVGIYLNFHTFNVYYNGELKKDAINEQKKREAKELIKKAYKETKMFRLTSKKKAEYIVDIELTQEGESNFNQAIFTWMTLYLYPSKATDKFTVKTVFKDQSGEVQAEVVKSDTVVMWQQLFMIFAMPFMYPYSELKEVVTDLNKESILEIFHEPFMKEL